MDLSGLGSVGVFLSRLLVREVKGEGLAKAERAISDGLIEDPKVWWGVTS